MSPRGDVATISLCQTPTSFSVSFLHRKMSPTALVELISLHGSFVESSISFAMLLIVYFVASYLQKYDCISLDTQLQATKCLTSHGLSRKAAPLSHRRGLEVCSSGSGAWALWSVSSTPSPLFSPVHHPQLVSVALSLPHGCHSPSTAPSHKHLPTGRKTGCHSPSTAPSHREKDRQKKGIHLYLKE